MVRRMVTVPPNTSVTQTATIAYLAATLDRTSTIRTGEKLLFGLRYSASEAITAWVCQTATKAASKAKNGPQANLARQRGPRSVTLGAPQVKRTAHPMRTLGQAVQWWPSGFAEVTAGGANVARMHDPRSQLSSQDLIYAATALRVEAHLTEQRAQEPRYGSTCRVFAEAAAQKRELADRVQRIAEMGRAMETPARSAGRNDESHRR